MNSRSEKEQKKKEPYPRRDETPIERNSDRQDLSAHLLCNPPA